MLIDELIERKCAVPSPSQRFKLHVVGHSFGGKLASLATHDAVQRRMARELFAGPTPVVRDDALVDSLVLLLPAMQASEMFWEVPLDVTDAAVGRVRAAESELQRTAPDRPPLLRRVSRFEKPSLAYPAVARRIGTKVLVHSRHDSANGWIFAAGDLVLDHDAVASAQNILTSKRLDRFFYGAYDELLHGKQRDDVEWPMYFTLPLAPIYGTVQFAARAGYAVGATVLSDASAVIDGFVVTGREFGRDFDGDADGDGGDVEDLWRDAFSFPVSPFLVQRSIGNQGLDYVQPLVNFADPTSWIDDTTADWLEHYRPIGATRFEEASRTLSPAFKQSLGDERRWIVCNARKVYNGSGLNLFGGAHGDIRAVTKSNPDDPDGLVKRTRTFQFVYNVTRAAATGTVR